MDQQLVPSWRFKQEKLAGYIVGGHEHGVELAVGADGNPVTGIMCMNVEHYYAKGCPGGRFVPRYKADVKSELLGPNKVRVEIAPHANWNVAASVTFDIRPERRILVTYDFTFNDDYKDFEAFISNYFVEGAEPYVHLGGKWVQPKLGDREHRYWARSARDASVIQDGRLDEFFKEMKEAFEAPVDPQHYDYPVMVTPTSSPEWYVIHVMEKGMCPSLSANRTWRAHDFSLIGRDVAKGERVTCRAWMVYTTMASLDDALNLLANLTVEA